jgi:hypothetical protein
MISFALRKSNSLLMLILQRLTLFCAVSIFLHVTCFAQGNKTDSAAAVQQQTPWYKKISIRGYAQLRYNKLLETNPALKCEQCDKSWGGENGFFFRRIRIIFYGQIHERVYFYIQPDFASSPGSGALNFGQIRDAYFDIGLDKQNTFRIRIGQSKVPFGFENLQSSQNRMPLDRNDALNSAVANERDLGMFFYWAPAKIRERFSYLVSSGLKGSGDYGVVGLGLYNGQTANRNDENGDPHVVARISYPLKLGKKQIVEPGLQAFRGKSVVSSVSSGVAGRERFEYLDQRAAASLVVYPQPFGVSAEYNVGTGPEYNPATNTIEQRTLKGGYAMASYFLAIKDQLLIPFVRYQYYNGGKKHELDARRYDVKELEVGAEWQVFKNFEMVAMYTISERRFEDGDKPDNFQKGRLLRLQFQLNF